MPTVTWQSTKGNFGLKSSERVNDPQHISPVICAGGDPVVRGHRVMTQCCRQRGGAGTRHNTAI